jgi:putative endonuclease
VTPYRKGIWSEWICSLILRAKGYRILEKRYKTPHGEIDLIALKKQELVFVEVKYRKVKTPDPVVFARQLRRIERSAQLYLKKMQLPLNIRFDIMLVMKGRMPQHFINVPIDPTRSKSYGS